MGAVDPTYPLYPLACVLSSVGVLLVLLVSLVRQNWNLGVAFLCFWLFAQNVTSAASSIVWSDNADIKLLVYCDIGTRLGVLRLTIVSLADTELGSLPHPRNNRRCQTNSHFYHCTSAVSHRQPEIGGSARYSSSKLHSSPLGSIIDTVSTETLEPRLRVVLRPDLPLDRGGSNM